MDSSIIEKLTRLTEEERDILRGQQVKQGDYSFSDRFIVNSAKLLEGRELDLRPHTRFVDFPEHGHDYMEFMYVYAGHISHVIGKETLTLERGDILFLNRHARHSVKRAGQEDIGINFILSNEFLQVIFQQVQNNPVMSEFLTNNFDDTGEEEYLLFRTKDCFPIRNLMDNLIYAIANRSQEVYAGLVSLLFTYLAYYRDTLANALRRSSPRQTAARRSLLSGRALPKCNAFGACGQTRLCARLSLPPHSHGFRKNLSDTASGAAHLCRRKAAARNLFRGRGDHSCGRI